jgi:uncharacterized protein
MDAIHIPHLLKKPQKTDRQEFRELFPQLETLTPVQGKIEVSHHETYLDVQGQADTIVTLTCDRCLQQYNHRLSFDTQELIWLENPPHPETLPDEREVASENLVESLPPQGYFEPDTWVYEQLCLAMPYRCLCDANCPAGSSLGRIGDTQATLVIVVP